MSKLNAAPQVAEPALSANECAILCAPLASFRSLLLCVSGGSDSVALLSLVASWAHARETAPDIFVATVDHGLREGAKEEAQFVQNLCTHLKLPHAILTWSGDKPTTKIQETARQKRYELLTHHARSHGCDALVTAHTLDDQAETILMRLSRGSGIKGLGGMALESQIDGLALMRPLLSTSRAKLRATLVERGQTWVEDPSNQNERFLRPRLRKLLPLLAEEGLTAKQLERISKKAKRADEALDFFTQQLLESLNQDQLLERSTYMQAPQEVRLRFLNEMIQRLNPTPYAAEDEALLALDHAVLSAEVTRRTLGGVVFSIGERFLRFSRENDPRLANRNSSSILEI